MALTNEVDILYRAKIDKAIKDIKKLEKGVEKSGKKQEGFLKKTGKAWKFLGAAIIGGIVVKAFKALTKRAIDAQETLSKFNTVFRDVIKSANIAAKELSSSFGLSNDKARELLASTGDLLTGFGFSQKAALDLSSEVNKLAVDLASFTNFSGGAEGASQALTKALLGERESVKALGISILEVDVQRQVAINNTKGLTFESKRQAKAFATLQIAQKQSKNAIGDFARTSKQTANQIRILKATLDNIAVTIGTKLLKVFSPLVSGFNKLITPQKDISTITTELIKKQKRLIAIEEELKNKTGELTEKRKEFLEIETDILQLDTGEQIDELIKRYEKLSQTFDGLKNDFEGSIDLQKRNIIATQQTIDRFLDWRAELKEDASQLNLYSGALRLAEIGAKNIDTAVAGLGQRILDLTSNLTKQKEELKGTGKEQDSILATLKLLITENKIAADIVERRNKGLFELAKNFKAEGEAATKSAGDVTKAAKKKAEIERITLEVAKNALDELKDLRVKAVEAGLSVEEAVSIKSIEILKDEIAKKKALGAEEKANIEELEEFKVEIFEKAKERDQGAFDEKIAKLEELKKKILFDQAEIDQIDEEIKITQAERDESSLEEKLNRINKFLNAGEIANNTFFRTTDLLQTKQSAVAKREHDRQLKDLQKAREKGLITEEEFNDQKAKLDFDLSEKQRKLKVKQQKLNKALAITGATINTAQAVTSALATPPPPVGIALASVIGGLGLAQVAIIASTPVDAFQQGGISGGGFAVVGEAGKELVNLPRGSRVFNNQETNEILQENGITIENMVVQTDNPDDFADQLETISEGTNSRPLGRGF